MCECPCPRRSGLADVVFWPLCGSFVTVSQRPQRPLTPPPHPCFSEWHKSVSINTETTKNTSNHEAAMLSCYYTRISAETLLFKRGWYGLKISFRLSLRLFETFFFKCELSLFFRVSPCLQVGFPGLAFGSGGRLNLRNLRRQLLLSHFGRLLTSDA